MYDRIQFKFILGTKITFKVILSSKRALEMSKVGIRAITMHFDGICGLKLKLNYPFKIYQIDQFKLEKTQKSKMSINSCIYFIETSLIIFQW